MARSDDVLDDPAHDRVEQQIAKPLPLVEQKPDQLLLVAEDALHADLASASACSVRRVRSAAASALLIAFSTMQ